MPDISQPLNVMIEETAVVCGKCYESIAKRRETFRSALSGHGVFPFQGGILQCPRCDEYFVEQSIYPDEMS